MRSMQACDAHQMEQLVKQSLYHTSVGYIVETKAQCEAIAQVESYLRTR